MPFQSEAQRRLLWAKNPKVARRWAHEYPGQHDLPYHKGDKKKKHEKSSSEGPLMSEFLNDIIDATLAAEAALSQAEKTAADRQAFEQLYYTKVGEFVQFAAQVGAIDDTDEHRQKLASSLENPLGAIDALKELLVTQKEASAQVLPAAQVDQHGRPVRGTTKKASWGSQDNPFVGTRQTGKKDSDLALERGLGLNLS